jgi:C-terminal processing protease CtpA/Prc
MWAGARPGCTLLYEGLQSTGVLDYAAPGSLAGLASADVLFDPSAYAYREGAFAGPLFLLVDRRSASATEQFASLLSDNGAATIIGERTYGAGCGYTNGGVRTRLTHTGLTLRAPDCARFRASGANEAEGIVPDVAAGWSDGDGGKERAEKVRHLIDRLLPRASVAMRGDGG